MFKVQIARPLALIALPLLFFQTVAFGQIVATSSEALASANDKNVGVLVRGVGIEDLRHLNLWTNVDSTHLPSGNNAVIGGRVAHALSIDVGDQILLINPVGQTPYGVMPNTMRVTVAAIIELSPLAEPTVTVYLSNEAFKNLSGDGR